MEENVVIVISEYVLKQNEQNSVSRVYYRGKNKLTCPECQTELVYRDSKTRILRREGGQKEYLIISRMRCPKCGKYHTVIPDCIQKNKHYAADIIQGVQEGIVTPDDEDSVDYPSITSMWRWKLEREDHY
jgi:predicted RNA-binding Zn-ribbon protein involved in translation (DUF1610 family)